MYNHSFRLCDYVLVTKNWDRDLFKGYFRAKDAIWLLDALCLVLVTGGGSESVFKFFKHATPLGLHGEQDSLDRHHRQRIDERLDSIPTQ